MKDLAATLTSAGGGRLILDAAGRPIAALRGRHVVDTSDDEDGQAVWDWYAEGCPRFSCVQDGDVLRQRSVLVAPDDPGFEEAVADQVAYRDWQFAYPGEGDPQGGDAGDRRGASALDDILPVRRDDRGVRGASGTALGKSATPPPAGTLTFQGLPIVVENEPGSFREWTDAQGRTGRTLMHFAYGYIKNTKAADGEGVDCYIGPNPDAAFAYVVRQQRPGEHAYDEDKCMLGFDSVGQAIDAYLMHYDDPRGLGPIDVAPMDEFKRRVTLTERLPGPVIA